MTTTDLKPGDRVRFHEKVFSVPYAPYYDLYKGHTFRVVQIDRGHVQLVGPIDVAGWVHLDELEKV